MRAARRRRLRASGQRRAPRRGASATVTPQSREAARCLSSATESLPEGGHVVLGARDVQKRAPVGSLVGGRLPQAVHHVAASAQARNDSTERDGQECFYVLKPPRTVPTHVEHSRLGGRSGREVAGHGNWMSLGFAVASPSQTGCALERRAHVEFSPPPESVQVVQRLRSQSV